MLVRSPLDFPPPPHTHTRRTQVELLTTEEEDKEEAKGTKRGLEPDTPSPEVTAQQYYAYGGGE